MIYHHLIANSKIVEGKGCLHRVVRIVQVNFKDIKVERIIGEPISLIEDSRTNLFTNKHICRILSLTFLCYFSMLCFISSIRAMAYIGQMRTCLTSLLA